MLLLCAHRRSLKAGRGLRVRTVCLQGEADPAAWLRVQRPSTHPDGREVGLSTLILIQAQKFGSKYVMRISFFFFFWKCSKRKGTLSAVWVRWICWWRGLETGWQHGWTGVHGPWSNVRGRTWIVGCPGKGNCTNLGRSVWTPLTHKGSGSIIRVFNNLFGISYFVSGRVEMSNVKWGWFILYWQEFSHTSVNSHRIIATQYSHGQILFLSANRRWTGVCISLSLPSQTIIGTWLKATEAVFFPCSLQAGVWNQGVTGLVSPGGCEGESVLPFFWHLVVPALLSSPASTWVPLASTSIFTRCLPYVC